LGVRTQELEIRAGATLGRYVVVSRLGAGGMGVVLAGYDPELDRKVALKVLHPGSGTGSEGRTRLLREAQALAKLSHPNVVAIHDTGTVGDSVWLAIEFVSGRTFAAWLRQRTRTWREVLAVLAEAGQGLAAAHAAGLVHRDFKPDNVMVDDDGRVRVMDFGLARATVPNKLEAAAISVDDVATRKLDASLEDTAPRKADASLDDTVPRASDMSLEATAPRASDMSLEATAPRTPDMSLEATGPRASDMSLEATAPRASDMSLEATAPRASDMSLSGTGLPGASASRSVLDEALTQTGSVFGTPAYMAPEQFAGAATDDRTDQYSFCATLWEALHGARPYTAPSFAELATKVLEAPPPAIPSGTAVPAWLSKIALRGISRAPEDRWPSMQVLLEALARGQGRARARRVALVVGIAAAGVASVAGARAIGRQRAAAACEERGDAIAQVWNEEAKARLSAGLLATGLPTAEVTAQKVMPWLDAQAGAWREATAQACLDTDVREVWDHDRHDRARWCLEEAKLQLAAVVDELSRADAGVVHGAVSTAASLADVSTCRDDEALSRMPVPPFDRRERADAVRVQLQRVHALVGAARYDAALPLARDALAQAESLAWPPILADARQQLSFVLAAKGEHTDAEVQLEEAFFAAAGAGSMDSAAQIADSLVLNVGKRQSRHADGIRWSRMAEVLRPDAEGLSLARHLQHEAAIRQEQGDQDRAIELFERALAIQETLLDPGHPTLAIALSNLGVARQAKGDDARARVDLERALAIREAALGVDHPDVASTLSNLAMVHRDSGDHDTAGTLHRRALAIRERVFGPDSALVAQSLNNLANALRDAGALEEAAQQFERALTIFEATEGPEHLHVGIALLNLANVHAQRGERGSARPLFERSLAIFEAKLGAEHPNTAIVLLGLAGLALDEKRADEALVLSERALRVLEAAKARPEQIADAQFMLAKAIVERGGDATRALELAQSALAAYLEAGDGAAEVRREVEEWLAGQRPADRPE
jgi:eukaryotic-like serine/threonine-protein kinase